MKGLLTDFEGGSSEINFGAFAPSDREQKSVIDRRTFQLTTPTCQLSTGVVHPAALREDHSQLRAFALTIDNPGSR